MTYGQRHHQQQPQPPASQQPASASSAPNTPRYTTPSYIERAPASFAPTSNSPPQPSHLVPSLVTDRLNWRRDARNDVPTQPSVNPSTFYRQIPGGASSSSATTSNFLAPTSSSSSAADPSAFYSFAVSSNTSSLDGLYSAPPSFFQPPPSVVVSTPAPAPALPPKPPSSPPRVTLSASFLYHPSPPPIPPKPPEYTNPTSLFAPHDSSFPSEKAAVPPPALRDGRDAEPESDDETLRQAILASQDSESTRLAHLAELEHKNAQLLLQHMRSINRARARREEFSVRDEDEQDGSDEDASGQLSLVDHRIPPQRKRTAEDESELMRRATMMSLKESREQVGDDGWEKYDPNAFEDAVLSMPLTIPTTGMGMEMMRQGYTPNARSRPSAVITGVNPLETIPRPVVLPSPPSTPHPHSPHPHAVPPRAPSPSVPPVGSEIYSPALPLEHAQQHPDAVPSDPEASELLHPSSQFQFESFSEEPSLNSSLDLGDPFISPLDQLVNVDPGSGPTSPSSSSQSHQEQVPAIDLTPTTSHFASSESPPFARPPPRNRNRASTSTSGPRARIGPRPNFPSAQTAQPSRTSLISERSPPAASHISENPAEHLHPQVQDSRLLRPEARPLRPSASHGDLQASAHVQANEAPPLVPPLPRAVSSYFASGHAQVIPPRPPSTSYGRHPTRPRDMSSVSTVSVSKEASTERSAESGEYAVTQAPLLIATSPPEEVLEADHDRDGTLTSASNSVSVLGSRPSSARSHTRGRSVSQAPPLRRSQWDDIEDRDDVEKRPSLPPSSFSEPPTADSGSSSPVLSLTTATSATAPTTPVAANISNLDSVVSYLVDLMAGVCECQSYCLVITSIAFSDCIFPYCLDFL